MDMVTTVMPLKQLLRELRDSVGLSQEELANRSGVPLGTVRRYEQGAVKEPGFVPVMKMVRACGGSLDDVMEQLYEEDPEQRQPRRRGGKKRRKQS